MTLQYFRVQIIARTLWPNAEIKLRGYAVFNFGTPLLAFLAGAIWATASLAENLTNARFEFERAIERTAKLTGSCLPTVEHLEKGEVHLVSVVGRREVGEVVTVEVRKGRRNVHLFLNATLPVTWKLEVDPGASVASVYSLGSHAADIEDLPEGALAYSIGYDAEGRRSRRCDPGEDIAKDFYAAAFYYSLDRHRHTTMERSLKAFANQEFASLPVIEIDYNVAVISGASMSNTRQKRLIGAAILDQLDLPVKQPIGDEVFQLPAGLSSDEIHDVLLLEGRAEVAGPHVTDFLCLREEAQYWAVGLDRKTFGIWCHAREIWDAGRHLVLTGSLDLGGSYDCEDGRRLVIYIPENVEVNGRLVNCDARFWTYEE